MYRLVVGTKVLALRIVCSFVVDSSLGIVHFTTMMFQFRDFLQGISFIFQNLCSDMIVFVKCKPLELVLRHSQW
jgi:hypothetical protein